ncbi:MAG TPA: hypothetical protein VLL75_12735 [Vicinamibacteria bacterium]|nr:hypothetical protein [Vicinamibacteria bacterium]
MSGDSSSATRGPWLVSMRWDVAVFGGSAALAFALLALGRHTSALDRPLPAVTWLLTVVFVDVAHVWATAYRVYLDPEERGRRTGLYAGIPVAAYVVGVLLYSASAALFWRVLAYVAVFHFVRQQYGWVALYRRRLGVPSRLDRWVDDAAIYSATLYPLLFWHAHLPREFEWFIPGDFIPGLPPGAAEALWPLHVAIALAFVARQAYLVARGRPVSPGKVLIVATTWLTWYAGIVVFDSDYAFTVTNVLVHGIPYLAFVWRYGRARFAQSTAAVAALFRPHRFLLYLAPLLAVAFAEEWGWDRLVWHEHGGLFPGPSFAPGAAALALLVPLLALPQATHYVLDAWIWRVRPENPDLARHLGYG